VTADSKRVVRLMVGKRTQEQTHPVVQDAKSRLRPGHLPALFTHASTGYEAAIFEAFGRRYPVSSAHQSGRPSRLQLR